MDVFEAILHDHEKIRDLVKKIRKTSKDNSPARDDAYEELRIYLLAHHEAEEASLYSEIVRHDRSQETGMHAIAEHGEHKKVIEQMENLKPGSENWEHRLAELIHDVLHHIDEEETDVFPVSRKVLTSQQAQALGKDMRRIMHEQLSRLRSAA
jgi:hemerythrin superfamily protein